MSLSTKFLSLDSSFVRGGRAARFFPDLSLALSLSLSLSRSLAALTLMLV